jgi:hypothetical protein
MTAGEGQQQFNWLTGSWKPASSTQELQMKGTSQRGHELLDMEAENATPLEAVTKQRSEGRDWEHYAVFDRDL